MMHLFLYDKSNEGVFKFPVQIIYLWGIFHNAIFLNLQDFFITPIGNPSHQFQVLYHEGIHSVPFSLFLLQLV